jgi:hypothetical protein
MAAYTSDSPYYNTQTVNGQYLDILRIRPIPAESDDILYTIETQYALRPDLLAYDLYGSTAGTEIYLPKGESLATRLGI